MSLTLEIGSELEPLLEAEAAKTGSTPSTVAQNLLRKSLASSNKVPRAPRVTNDEARLLEEINQGPSTAEMERYFALIRKRQEETISDAELGELRAFSKRIEQQAVTRMRSIAKLAKLRGRRVEEVMAELQIEPPDVL